MIHQSTTLKFLCDQMLARVGRWLRAAGYDTAIAQAACPDSDLYRQGKEENRILLTRDKYFAQIKAPEVVIIYNNAESTDKWVDLLSEQLPMNWLYQPFSRCLLCNTLLKEPPEASLKDIPEDVRLMQKSFRYCVHCNKVYWEGSHTDRMLKQLQIWNSITRGNL